MRVAVVTPVAGRHEHLMEQRRHMRALGDDGLHVIVGMGDDELAQLLRHERGVALEQTPLGAHGALPLARARNRGFARAIDLGADLVVGLDVDCLPGQMMMQRYADAARGAGTTEVLLAGPVTYLPEHAGAPAPDQLCAWTNPHPARPNPEVGEVVAGDDPNLFWSLSFAMTPRAWLRTGGFCAAYEGYGAEDTDFAHRAAARGVPLQWVGGAHAFHQHHPTATPPIHHLADVVANANIFFGQWGWWPMLSWLEDFRDAGLAHVVDGRWEVVGDVGTNA